MFPVSEVPNGHMDSNFGDLAMEVMNDLSLFLFLGHVAIEMIGDDRPYSLVLGMMSSLTRSLGMVPKLTYNNFPLKHEIQIIRTFD